MVALLVVVGVVVAAESLSLPYCSYDLPPVFESGIGT